MEVLPSLLVATRKPPKRLKARIVACGNFAAGAGIASADNAAGGCDNGTVRLLVSTSAHHGWSISTVDVRTAFLQAPRRPTPGKSTVVQPPQILKEANVLGSTTERWEVTGALYGLVESPRDWNDFRNSKMQEMAWHSPSGDLFLEKTPEPHLWKIKLSGKEQKDEVSSVVGFVAVYIDDLMIAGEPWAVEETLSQFGKTFNLAEPEHVTEGKEVTFCGFQIRKVEGGFAVGQRKYIENLIQRRQVTGFESTPCFKINDEPDEIDPSPKLIKEAQTITGELGWITSAYKARIGVFSGSYGSHGSSKTITDGEDWTTGTTVSEWNSVSRDGFSED